MLKMDTLYCDDLRVGPEDSSFFASPVNPVILQFHSEGVKKARNYA